MPLEFVESIGDYRLRPTSRRLRSGPNSGIDSNFPAPLSSHLIVSRRQLRISESSIGLFGVSRAIDHEIAVIEAYIG